MRRIVSYEVIGRSGNWTIVANYTDQHSMLSGHEFIPNKFTTREDAIEFGDCLIGLCPDTLDLCYETHCDLSEIML